MLQFKSPTSKNHKPAYLQTKLKIGRPGDKYEQEADAVADRVMNMSSKETMQMQPIEEAKEMMQPKLRMKPKDSNEGLIQMMCEYCGGEEVLQTQPLEEEEEMLQPKRNQDNPANMNSISSQLNSSKNKGSLLPNATNQWMTRAMGTDFSGVKIHTGSQAIQMNKQLGARAFTHGNGIYFNKGQYQPDSSDGKRLLAHELTHVVQQNSMSSSNIISRIPEKANASALPTKERGELKRLTGNRIDRSAAYYNDALLEVKIKVGNMLKEQKAAADAMFELAFGLLMPGLGKLLGKGLASMAANLPAAASTASYKAAIALLDADRTKDLFVKATDIGLKISKIDINSKLKSITGNAEYEVFFTALEKSAAAGFDKLDADLSNKSDKELGILYLSYDPVETSSSDYVKVIEDLFQKFKEQVQPIGKKTGGSYGRMKARWIEGAKWKALALTGEGRYFNVGAGPTFIAWISPEMKNPAIEATKAIGSWVDTVHYGSITATGSTTSTGMKYLLDSDFPLAGGDKVLEPSSGTTKMPSKQACPSCHGENRGGNSPNFPEFEFPEREIFPQTGVPSISDSDMQAIREWIQSIPKE